jgi:hypothetical protein
LATQIDSLASEDQKWRSILKKVDSHLTKQFSHDEVVSKIRQTDSLNYIQLRRIFERHGYPTADQIGRSAVTSFGLLLQHADRHPAFQDSVLVKMKSQAANKKVRWSDYAFLIDRIKVTRGEAQVYGTQLMQDSVGNYKPKPVIEPEKLNQRRKEIGLSTIEEYLRTMNQ